MPGLGHRQIPVPSERGKPLGEDKAQLEVRAADQPPGPQIGTMLQTPTVTGRENHSVQKQHTL